MMRLCFNFSAFASVYTCREMVIAYACVRGQFRVIALIVRAADFVAHSSRIQKDHCPAWIAKLPVAGPNESRRAGCRLPLTHALAQSLDQSNAPVAAGVLICISIRPDPQQIRLNWAEGKIRGIYPGEWMCARITKCLENLFSIQNLAPIKKKRQSLWINFMTISC